MRNSIITFVLFIFITLSGVFAQQMPFSSQYYSNQFITNPALTGNKGDVNAFLTHRTQWTGISGAPQTAYFTMDGPVKRAGVGLGLTMFSDVTDILTRNGANASYSYRLTLKPDNYLTFGLALGIINNKINFSKVVVVDLSDPILQSQQQARTVINADLGLAYNFKKLEVGFAVPQVIGNRVQYQNNLGLTGTYNLARHYYGSLKYTFDINTAKEITAYPLVMVRSVAGAPFQYDVNAVIDWKKIGWFGVTYHSNYAVAFSAGLRYKSIAIGYARDLGVSRIKNYTGNTNEFLLSYNFGEKEDSKAIIDELKTKVDDLQQKDSVKQTQIDDLILKDSIKDSIIKKLTIQADSNKIEIDSLKTLLRKLDEKKIVSPVASPSDDLKKQKEEQDRIKAEQAKIDAEKARIAKELADAQKKDSTTDLALELAKTDVSMKTASTKDFSSQGSDAEAGYYVIIGAFGNVDNAKVFTKDAKKKGYVTAEIIQNKKNQIYEIVVMKTRDKTVALEKLPLIIKDYFDVWVLTLE